MYFISTYYKSTYVPKKEKRVSMDIVLENYLMPVEYGLSSKIYFLAYEKPKSAYEISFEIYDKYHHSIITKINELKEDNFFMPITIKGKKHPKWLSSIEPLISMIYFIKEKDKVSFTELEKHILVKILDSEAFRKFTSNKQIYKQIRGDFNAIDFILMKLDCLAIEYLSSKAICEIGIIIDKKIKNKEQYDNFIKESLESSSMEDLIDVISDGKEYYREVKKKQSSEDMGNILRGMSVKGRKKFKGKRKVNARK